MKSARTFVAFGFAAVAATLLGACAPTLDWREVRPEGSDAQALFPCKPELLSRPAGGAHAPGRMGLAQCKAGGASFSLSWAEVADPAQVAPALRQMRESLATKLAAKPGELLPVQVAGMTPNPEAQMQTLLGANQSAQVAVFTRGQLVYQAMLLSPKPDAAGWQTFLAALKLGGAQ
ncbi:hypothetical protein [Paucibacter sp. KCTC 42545]|uniref:hypothetical protein n=1 Tax=Paucibacter sp. KCTC 42545 TaxID=1768242 RepID=UPI000733BC24|nr:hypothetical protein [Paucibacter sp. KCTC 42545]ALT79497.1 hypothetical protein AT984_22140 [Paucibacter sp. KCTC 42545]